MRVLSWALLMIGLSAFTLGCSGDKPAPVENDATPAAEGHEGHDHAEGDEHMHEGAPAEPAATEEPAAPEEPAAEPAAEAAAPAVEDVQLDPAVGN